MPSRSQKNPAADSTNQHGFDEETRKLSQQFFESELRQYGEVMPASGQDDSKLVELLQAAIPSRKNFQLLDIGCGLGYVARAVKTLSPRGKARELDSSNTVSYEVADELNLPFENESFDVAVCRYSIHHYPDVVAHLREARRILRPGGTYLVIDPTPEPGNYDDWLNELFITVERSTSGHVKFYTVTEYENFAKAAGFRIGKIEPFDLKLELDTDRPHYAVIRGMSAAFHRMVAFETQANRFSIVMKAAGIYCDKT